MSRIRILIVDDQALFREGLRLMLGSYADLEVVGEAANGVDALTVACAVHPAVTLMDLRMPLLDGVAATQRFQTMVPCCRVILLTSFDDDRDIMAGLQAGAQSYVLKTSTSAQLADTIRAVVRGETLLHPAIATKVVMALRQRPPTHTPMRVLPHLSARELEVVRLIAQGASNKTIAQTLVLAEATVKNHVTNILGKLEVTDRTAAAMKARDLGLL